jgi:hypothetical protein
MLRTLAISAVLAATAASSANAELFYRYTRNQPSNQWYSTIVAEYAPTSHRFKWEFTSGTQVNGFWLVVSPGPNPKGHPGELAIIYFDAKTLTANNSITPTATIYNYNGVNNASSWNDGAPTAGVQTPDRIWSSLDSGDAASIIQLSATDNGTSRRFVFEIDATAIQTHTPLYPNPNGDDWTGLAFGAKLGTWFHPMSGMTTSYGTDPSAANFNFLTSFGYAQQASFDTANLNTELLPAPGAVALLGFAGLAGARRRRA